MATITEQKVYEMITENTGRHFLDSGGAYGRHWERNQTVPIEAFIQQEPVYYRAKCYRDGNLEMNVIQSLFHHLVDNLDYDEYYDKVFQRYIKMDDAKQELNDNPVRYWHEQMDDFDKLAKHNDRWKDEYGWSERYNQDYDFDGYSYNEENILSQDFVYHTRGDFALIQTHNGCDARGGFSAPVLFRQSGMSECGIIDFSRFTIACPNRHYWSFESAGYYQTDSEDGSKWKDFEVADLDSYNADEVNFDERLKQLKVERRAWENQLPLIGEDKPDFVPSNSEWGGLIIVKDEIAHCPLCGEELHTYLY